MRILAIHPLNEDLRFLNKFIIQMENEFGDFFNSATLANNYSSHEKALTLIDNLEENDIVFLLIHGATRVIYGCEYRSKFATHSKRYVHFDKYGYFIDKNNIHVLSNKKIICLSCNSDSLGKLAIESGARLFIGFSVIDFDNRSQLLANQKPRQSVIAKTKYSLRNSLFNAIKISLKENLSHSEFLALLKICINVEMDRLIIENKGKRGYEYYKTAAGCLYNIKEGIVLYGDGTAKF